MKRPASHGAPVLDCLAVHLQPERVMARRVRARWRGGGGAAARAPTRGRRAQERPVRADALLGGSERAVGLAALSDSAEYIADVIQTAAGHDGAGAGAGAGGAAGGGGGGAAPPPPPEGAAGGQPRTKRQLLTEGLKHLIDRRAPGPTHCAPHGSQRASRQRPCRGASCAPAA